MPTAAMLKPLSAPEWRLLATGDRAEWYLPQVPGGCCAR
nr:hypothetical protein JVH1_4112 [Rhodococcus sp. JVH1]